MLKRGTEDEILNLQTRVGSCVSPFGICGSIVPPVGSARAVWHVQHGNAYVRTCVIVPLGQLNATRLSLRFLPLSSATSLSFNPCHALVV